MAKPVEVEDQNFDQVVLKSPNPVLVDFWAPWCGPCRMVSPIVEELASEYAGKINFAKLNTDDNVNTAIKFGVRSIPTLMLFKDGKVASTVIGFRPKSELKKQLDAVLDRA